MCKCPAACGCQADIVLPDRLRPAPKWYWSLGKQRMSSRRCKRSSPGSLWIQVSLALAKQKVPTAEVKLAQGRLQTPINFVLPKAKSAVTYPSCFRDSTSNSSLSRKELQ